MKLTCICLAVFALSAAALAQNWQTVYQTDFSSNPNWITNDSANNYWNTAEQNYHAKYSTAGGQYAYIPVPFIQGNSYKLEFDLAVANVGFHGGSMRLGLGDSNMNVYAPATFYAAYWNAGSGSEPYRGNVLGEFYSDSQGNSFVSYLSPLPNHFTTNTWYRNVLTYDYSAGTLSLTVTRLSDGFLMGTQTKTGVGTFSGIDRIYLSSIGDNDYPGLAGEGYIDNVTLSTVPEPASLLLLGLGGLLLRNRKTS